MSQTERVSAPTIEHMFEGAGPIARADVANTRVGGAQRELLTAIAEIDRSDAWRDDGARDCAHWVSMRYGISHWKAARLLHAGQVLGSLPGISRALS